ncbi:MAG: hypothetical protein LBQ75_08335 [Zoogloeaceae bacterium]|nr:hypothetical protein [Zoogloeaceae bacterium]
MASLYGCRILTDSSRRGIEPVRFMGQPHEDLFHGERIHLFHRAAVIV